MLSNESEYWVCSGNLSTILPHWQYWIWGNFQCVLVQKDEVYHDVWVYRLLNAEKKCPQKASCIEWLNWNLHVIMSTKRYGITEKTSRPSTHTNKRLKNCVPPWSQFSPPVHRWLPYIDVITLIPCLPPGSQVDEQSLLFT